jgi:hypothetical protein
LIQSDVSTKKTRERRSERESERERANCGKGNRDSVAQQYKSLVGGVLWWHLMMTMMIGECPLVQKRSREETRLCTKDDR